MDERWRFTQFLLSFQGIPYIWGGSNALVGLDCSGAAQLWLARLGLDPPKDQTAHGLFTHFSAAANGKVVSVADLATLTFYGSISHVTHVGMALDRLRMVEAGGGGSDTTTRLIAEQKGAEVKVSRIRRRADLVAMIAPLHLPW